MPTRTWRGNTYRFTVTSATATAGDTYTNNGQTFTVTDTITAGTVLYCFGTGAPTASGNLVRTSGAGTNPIVFSAVTAPNTNWGTATNWLENAVPTALSNGPNGPSTGDDVVFNANSRDCVVNVNSTCLTLNFTGYVNTFTINNGITLSFLGNSVILGSGMTFTSGTTGVLRDNPTAAPSTTVGVSGNYTINFNGIVIPNLTVGSAALNGPVTRIFTVSGTTPTVNNLVVNNGYFNFNVQLSGVLNVNTSLTMTLGYIGIGSLGSAVNLTGNVAVSGSGIIGIITIPSGGTLNMSNDLFIENITFSGTGALIHNNRTVNFTRVGFNSKIINTNTVEWWNVNITTSNCTFTSNLNVGNDFNDTGADYTSSAGVTINVKRNISFGGNGVATSSNLLSIITITAFGTGSVTMVNGYQVSGLRLIIGSASTGYTLGSAIRLNFSTTGTNSLTLVGNTATASFFSTTAMTLTSLWTFDVNRTATGGSEIILPNLNVGGGSGIVTLVTETKCSNFSTTGGVVLNGAKLLVSGNIAVTSFVQGTSTIEMTGGDARTMSIPDLRLNLIINKSGGVAVTSLVNMTVSAAITLSLSSLTNFGTTLVTLGGFAITINNPSASQFYDLTINGGNAYALNHLITVLRNLTLLGSLGNITFAGTAGWICANLLCPTPNRTITLVAGVTYTTTTSVNMVGTAAQPITMISSNPSAARSTWTLSQGASQSLVYVNGRAIDSSLGQTVWTFGGIITTALVPLNWGVGVRPVAYGYIIFN
jgi:hypothetical protein